MRSCPNGTCGICAGEFEISSAIVSHTTGQEACRTRRDHIVEAVYEVGHHIEVLRCIGKLGAVIDGFR
jgi:histone acetyltransferase (RNA polymerase elongator complex component)